MQYFILAAGKGTRLKNLTLDKPKALLELRRNEDILGFQKRVIREFDESADIYVVTGYLAQTIREKHPDLTEIYNPHFEDMNNIYSVFIMRDFVKDDFILLNGDTVFHPLILKKLLTVDKGTYCVVDNVKILGIEEMKVIIRDDRIIRFGKDIPPEDAHGEYIGLSRFTQSDADVLFAKIEKMLKENNGHMWYENAYSRISDRVRFIPLFTDGLLWVEVDNESDYKKAREIVWKFND